MLFGIAHFEHDVIQIAARDAGAWLGRRREIARHRGIRREQVVVVRAAVIGVLLFLLQNADHGIRNALHQHGRADRGLPGKQLPVGFRSQQHHAPALALVVFGDQAAFGNL